VSEITITDVTGEPESDASLEHCIDLLTARLADFKRAQQDPEMFVYMGGMLRLLLELKDYRRALNVAMSKKVTSEG